MRIIAGTLRGRKIQSPLSSATRPTSDRTRETMFNILHHCLLSHGETFHHHKTLDVFAGTGALGLEAISRGSPLAVFIEREPLALRTLAQNIHALHLQHQSRIIPCNALRLRTSSEAFSLVFLDPPYGKNFLTTTLTRLEQGGWLQDQAFILCEIGPKDPFDVQGIQGRYTLITERELSHCRILLLRFSNT
jgi:16S rRNA (guanine966-N2)-methyltransferase